jgi:hypothetical protein
MKSNLIAPCGMNCNLCIAHLRDRQKCPGCRGCDKNKSKSCIYCAIKNCKFLNQKKWRYCSDKCTEFPCLRLKRLDKRYKTKYGMSMIENLKAISSNGIREFILDEEKRWVRGDRIFCVHKKKYFPL